MTLPSIYLPGSPGIFFVILIRPLEIRNISSHITRKKGGTRIILNLFKSLVGYSKPFLLILAWLCNHLKDVGINMKHACCSTQSAANHMIEWLTTNDERVDLINLFSLP